MIAAMIDGVWLRAALSEWREADSESARALLTAFVEGRLKDLAHGARGRDGRCSAHPRRAPSGGALRVINPANGTLLAEIAVDGAAQIDAAVARAQAAQRRWAALSGAERGRILQRAAQLLRERNDELAELETLNTGKPIQETRAVDVLSGAECLEYYAGLAAGIAGEHLDLGPAAFGYTRREPLGRGRRHRRLELSAADRLLEVGAGARVRQRHDVQARRADAAHARSGSRRCTAPPACRTGCSRWCRARPRPGAS